MDWVAGPAFSITPSTRTGKHIRRDIVVLLERRNELLDNSPMREGGADLLWTVPWNGAKVESLLLNALDPLYIEVCRRVRLRVGNDGRLHAIRATSKAAPYRSQSAQRRSLAIRGLPLTEAPASR